MSRFLPLVPMLFLLCHVSPASAELLPVWTFAPAAEQFDGSVGIADLTGDGAPEIVATTIQGAVIALNAQGGELWRWRQPDPISVSPTIAEAMASSPGPEVLVITNTGRVYCLKGGNGEILWLDSLSSGITWGAAGIAAADLDRDGNLEFVMADAAGEVSAKRGDGAELWTHHEAGGLKSAPAVGDLDGDGNLEVLFAAETAPLLCLSHDGKPLWSMAGSTPGGGAPLLCDLDGDGLPEILGGTGDTLYAAGHDGVVKWSVPLSGALDSGVSAADLDGDGTPEVIAADLSGGVAVFGADGAPRWTANVEARTRRSPTVADLDGDGSPEVLVAGYSGQIHIFKATGELADRVALGGPCNASAAVARLADGGPLTVLCPTVTGTLFAHQWPGSNGGDILFPEYRFNAERTGEVRWAARKPGVRLVKMDTGRAHVGRNELAVVVENPDGEALTVALEVTQNGRPARKETVSSSNEIRAVLAYVVGARGEADLRFSCAVLRDGAEVLRQERALKAAPFSAELAEAGLAVARIAEHAKSLPSDIAPALEKEALYWQARLPGLRERAALTSLLSAQELYALGRDLDAARAAAGRLASVAAKRAETGAPLAVCAANPWATFAGMDELAEGRWTGPEVVVNAFSGEIESAALNVFNLSSAALTVRVDAGPLKGPDGAEAPKTALITREAVAVPTQLSDTVADAIPRLGEGRTLVVPALDARQLFFEVDTAGLAPGAWTAEIRLRGLDIAGTEAKALLKLTVWPPTLPEKRTLGLCHWGYVGSSLIKEHPEEALADQVRHGTTVFVCLHPPKAKFDADGNLTGPLDFAEHDAYLDAHAKHGLMLFYTYDSAIRGPAEKFSDPWNKAHVAYLRAWVEHLKARGMTYDDWALYTIDEPGLRPGLVDIHIKLGKLAREADPSIRVYTDPVGDASMDDLRAMLPVTDLWCPHRNGIVNKPDPEKFALIQNAGGTVFTYECQDNVKHRSPLGYYRGQAWLCWRHQLKAMGFWTYCTSQYDPWFNNGESEYLLIYPGDAVVSSKRWHAVRDGSEDHALLTALRAAADAAEAAGKAPDAVAEARALLGERAEEVARFCGLDEDGELPGPGGVAAQRVVEDRRWQILQTLRADMARLFDALK